MKGGQKSSGLENGESTSQFRLMDEGLGREEVVQALGDLKKKVAVGRDGLTQYHTKHYVG